MYAYRVGSTTTEAKLLGSSEIVEKKFRSLNFLDKSLQECLKSIFYIYVIETLKLFYPWRVTFKLT